MTINQKITKAKNIYLWVEIYDQDGEYIETSKAKLLNVLRQTNIEDLDQNKFNLREDGDLYVN